MAASARARSPRATVKVRSVLRPSSDTFCTIMSTLTPASASGPKIAAAMPGWSRNPVQRDLRLVARIGDAGDGFLFHDIFLVAEKRAAALRESKVESTRTGTR